MPDGRNLVYRSGDQIMSVSYTVKGDAFVAEKPRVWLASLGGKVTGYDYDLDLIHKRVLRLLPAESAPDHEVVLLQNFFDELRRRAPLR